MEAEHAIIGGLAASIAVLGRVIEYLITGVARRRNGGKSDQGARCEAIEHRLGEVESTCRRCMQNGGPFIRRGEFEAWRSGVEREYDRLNRGIERASAALARARRGRGFDGQS